MKTKCYFFIFLILITVGCNSANQSYIWSQNVRMPENFTKEKQQAVANCAVMKASLSDLKIELVRMFPDVRKDWINQIHLSVVNAAKVYDSYGKGFQVWIQMPSSQEVYGTPSPVVEKVAAVIQEQVKVCSVE